MDNVLLCSSVGKSGLEKVGDFGPELKRIVFGVVGCHDFLPFLAFWEDLKFKGFKGKVSGNLVFQGR